MAIEDRRQDDLPDQRGGGHGARLRPVGVPGPTSRV